MKTAVTRGELFPVACGVATKNLGTTAVLDLLVEGIPSPAKKGAPIEIEGATGRSVRLQDRRRPVRGPHQHLPRARGPIGSDSTLANVRTHDKERVGQLLTLQGKEHEPADEFGEGDLGAVSKLKDVRTGDLLLDADRDVELPSLDFPEPVMSFAITPKAKGDEEKVATSLRRLSEEDPTLQLRRDPQTGEQLLSGMTQMHVEVAVDRLKRRFGVEVDLVSRASRTSRRSARSRGATAATRSRPAAAASSATATSSSSRSKATPATSSWTRSSAVSSRRASGPPSTRASRRRCRGRARGRARARRAGLARGRLVPHRRFLGDGVQDRRLDGVQAGLRAGGPGVARADHGGRVTVPDDTVGAVNGDLNSRRGRLQGMEPSGGMTQIKAEVPMAEMLTYGQALTSMTGGRGDYHMQFLRYDEVPSHVAREADRGDEEGARRSESLSEREEAKARASASRCRLPRP